MAYVIKQLCSFCDFFCISSPFCVRWSYEVA